MPRRRPADDMRRYWDERARENAVWYVDTSLAYDEPDMERFWETGRAIVQAAFVEAPIQPQRRELAVEVGSGLGRICNALAEHFERVVGLDISAEMVARARELVDDPAVSFEVGDGTTLAPLGDASADYLTSFTVFQHQSRRSTVARYLAEAGRVLRSGGVLAVQWNNQPVLRYTLQGWKWRLLRRIGRMPDNRSAAQFVGVAVPVRFMRRHLEAAGFEIVATKDEGTLFCWVWAVKREVGVDHRLRS